MMVPLSTGSFDFAGQDDFARLSGDFNPLHVDPVFARRTMYGEPVVHGIHLVLWALDQWIANQENVISLLELKVRFHKAVLLNTPIVLEESRGTENSFRLVAGDQSFEIAGHFRLRSNDESWPELPQQGESFFGLRGSSELLDHEFLPQSRPPVGRPEFTTCAKVNSCRELSFAEASAEEGSIPLYLDRERLIRHFPHLAIKLPDVQIAQILASTRLTGMICPGQRSIFHDLELIFEENSDPLQMQFRNHHHDVRFSILQLAVRGYGMHGVLTSYFNGTPVRQPSLVDVAREVNPSEFRGHKALILGGSRGLGELAAKILVAGGGSVRCSYHRGRQDAERLVAELRDFGADADCFAWDVEDADATSLHHLLRHWKPDSLFYFASPRLEPSKKGDPFSEEKYARYRRYFDHGLLRTLDDLRRQGNDSMFVFYPSTAILDSGEERWPELARAKAEGEQSLAEYLQKNGCGRYHAPRLPWLPTDSTVALRLPRLGNALTILLSEIRKAFRPEERLDP